MAGLGAGDAANAGAAAFEEGEGMGYRLLLSIQATRASLQWKEGNVRLIVETVLPDAYVLPVVEELQAQQEREPALPEIFIRMEVPGLAEPETGNQWGGESRG